MKRFLPFAVAATVTVFVGAVAFAAVGPDFQGIPNVPGLNFKTSQLLTQCVYDGGSPGAAGAFTACWTVPQAVGLTLHQTGQCPADGGSGFECFLSGQPNSTCYAQDGGYAVFTYTDGGACLPGLQVTDKVQIQPLGSGANFYSGSCGVLNDGGQVVIGCDAGTVINWEREQ